jgi:Cdc6-like AAA superfamily ATPase
MTELGLQPRRLADLTPENLRRLMEDIGRGPGWYASADLYRWYVGMCEEDKLEPVTQRKFGGVLRELKYRSAVRRVDGKHTRCWYISNRALRGEGAPRG